MWECMCVVLVVVAAATAAYVPTCTCVCTCVHVHVEAKGSWCLPQLLHTLTYETHCHTELEPTNQLDHCCSLLSSSAGAAGTMLSHLALTGFWACKRRTCAGSYSCCEFDYSAPVLTRRHCSPQSFPSSSSWDLSTPSPMIFPEQWGGGTCCGPTSVGFYVPG